MNVSIPIAHYDSSSCFLLAKNKKPKLLVLKSFRLLYCGCLPGDQWQWRAMIEALALDPFKMVLSTSMSNIYTYKMFVYVHMDVYMSLLSSLLSWLSNHVTSWSFFGNLSYNLGTLDPFKMVSTSILILCSNAVEDVHMDVFFLPCRLKKIILAPTGQLWLWALEIGITTTTWWWPHVFPMS